MRTALLVSPSAKAGGAERAFASLARALPDAGWNPSVALLEEGPLEDWLADAGVAATILPAGRTRQLHRTVRTTLQLRRLARRVGRDGVVLSNMAKGHVYGGAAAATSGVPAIWWQHVVPRRSRIEVVAARVPARAVACVSEDAASAQRRLTPGRRVVRIHPGLPVNAVAAARGAGATVRATLGWEACRIVGVVGRLQSGKGHDVFLEAAALLRDAQPDVCFAVVGGAILGWEGTYESDLHDQARRLGIDDRVHFAGHQAKPWDWLDALDVVVHTSVGDSFGLVLVEAMALGKPLVATASGGPAEVVEDGVSGLLVPPNNPRALAHAIVRLLEDAPLRERLARGAVERAGSFSEQQTAREFAQLFVAASTESGRE